jgi:aspartate/methionine/tyrosine aminotransferase
LRELGFTVPVTPDGAFYVYVDCTALLGGSANADALTRDILQVAGVVLVPGLDFGPHTAHNFIRVSYATSMANLEEAVRRLQTYFSTR